MLPIQLLKCVMEIDVFFGAPFSPFIAVLHRLACESGGCSN